AASVLPPVAIVRTGQYLAGSVDFVCSNVRAAPFDLFIGGAAMEANYPIGPLAGTAFNLTTMSYRGWLFLGLMVDAAAVPDPGGRLAQLDRSYDALLAAGGVTERARPWAPGPATGSVRRDLGVQLREHAAHVQQEVGDLGGGHDLAVGHLTEALLDQ